MLVNYHAPRHVYIVCGNTDLRKGIDTLAILIADNFGLDLYDDSLFLFCGRRNDFWDRWPDGQKTVFDIEKAICSMIKQSR